MRLTKQLQLWTTPLRGSQQPHQLLHTFCGLRYRLMLSDYASQRVITSRRVKCVIQNTFSLLWATAQLNRQTLQKRNAKEHFMWSKRHSWKLTVPAIIPHYFCTISFGRQKLELHWQRHETIDFMVRPRFWLWKMQKKKKNLTRAHIQTHKHKPLGICLRASIVQFAQLSVPKNSAKEIHEKRGSNNPHRRPLSAKNTTQQNKRRCIGRQWTKTRNN